MKRTFFLLALFVLIATTVYAQNIQLHYDFGRTLYNDDLSSRPLVTTTVENFHADNWGNTFFFIDMDYTSEGVACAYWEVSRELKFWKTPVSAHFEYNGGVAKGFSFYNSWLVGPSYSYNNASFSRGFTFMPLYKYIQKFDTPHNMQLTGVWYMHFCDELYSCTGFADWCIDKTMFGSSYFLSEPQFWINLNKLKKVDDKFRLSVGTEVKVSHNFVGSGLYIIPTLAVKWTIR